jgi:hypothetical protein
MAMLPDIRNTGDLAFLFEEAASVERLLPNKERSMLRAKCGWPEYIYEYKERQGWLDQERIRATITAQQIDALDAAITLLNLLGVQRDSRVIAGKKIIWARANRASFRTIASVVGIPPTTVKRWYEQDIHIIFSRMKKNVAQMEREMVL